MSAVAVVSQWEASDARIEGHETETLFESDDRMTGTGEKVLTVCCNMIMRMNVEVNVHRCSRSLMLRCLVALGEGL